MTHSIAPTTPTTLHLGSFGNMFAAMVLDALGRVLVYEITTDLDDLRTYMTGLYPTLPVVLEVRS